MAATTTRTFYGDIPLDAQGVPSLQFDKADVLIKFGDDPVDWLLLHREVLRAASPVFKAAFSDDWVSMKSTVVNHPSSSRNVEVAVLALTVDYDTYVLEGMVSYSFEV
ncbi:hypothetical protein B0A48_17317 [Cryoendolithus antarcticus]|uniref:BTB domain-containing protein n=1 Tax=Cryoendolithus antarcticus TaxID=1507870 RepID=A0A1V8SCC9_9PEZI|nr:hypothetical protein B0A48_17317 [Cryoendolithus antarcticus]